MKYRKKTSKEVNVLDSLPPTPLDLNAWKREYSNTKDLYGKAMSWFWKNYDTAGYSIWFMKYDKVEGECKQGFLTSNQLNGFIQRMDNNFRKYSFAVNNILECSDGFDIQGVWLFRGQEIPLEMKSHPSFEFHHFTKLDVNNPQHKKMIEDYWCADEKIDNQRIEDCVVWK